MDWYQNHFLNDDYPLYNLWKTPVFYFIDGNSSNDESSKSENSKSENSKSETSKTEDSIQSSSSEYNAKSESKSRIPQKQLKLSPSCILKGCVCGHQVIYRDMVYESRKKRISQGVTIRPKIPPIKVKLKQ